MRSLLGTVALAAKNFNLSKQFNENVKAIWEKRVEEHAQYFSGINARRIINAIDGLDVNLKPQTREKLMALSSRYGKRDLAPKEDRDIDDYDELRGSSRTAQRGSAVGGRTPAGSRPAAARDDAFDDYDDFQIGADAGKNTRGGQGVARARRGEGFDEKPF